MDWLGGSNHDVAGSCPCMIELYKQNEYLLTQTQLVLFMLSMGASLSGGDFVEIVRRPKFFVSGALCQFLIAPLLAWLIIHLFDVSEGIAVGLILVSAMPGGAMSKAFTYFGQGNFALSIALSALGTLASVVTVPAVLRLLAYEHIPDEFKMPVLEVMRLVALYLVLPVLVGMMVARLLPARRALIAKLCVRTGLTLILIIVAGSIASGRIHPGEYGWRAPVAIILFCVLTMQASMLPFRLLHWSRADCLSVGVEATMRNMNLALLLQESLFRLGRASNPIADGVLFVVLFYAATALVAGSLLSLKFRRMARRDVTVAKWY